MGEGKGTVGGFITLITNLIKGSERALKNKESYLGFRRLVLKGSKSGGQILMGEGFQNTPYKKLSKLKEFRGLHLIK
jgi:hypothetical protein